MAPIRVLVVDDAAVVRRLVTEALRDDPDLEVAGTAPNGKLAIAQIEKLSPDVVTLDVEMPEMDGLEAVRKIRSINRRLPIIMFSTLTVRGAAATLDALASGANDYVTKPVVTGGIDEAVARVRGELIPRIKALCGRAPARVQPVSTAAPAAPRPATSMRPGPVRVVGIASSTGGPAALADVLRALPPDLSVPVLIAQHMPPIFTRLLAERLSATTRHSVAEAASGEVLTPGKIWIAPGDHHLEVERVSGQGFQLKVHQAPPENSCRPSADVLLRSLARHYGNGTLGVVLTGMGADGLAGCRVIREAGGRVLVQDEATSVVWGMPGLVAEAGLADRILPLGEVAGAISQLALAGRADRAVAGR